MEPIRVDVIAPLPEGWGLCVTCEAFIAQAEIVSRPQERSMESFPPDWQLDFQHLSDLVERIASKYGDHVQLRLYDPRSIQGMVRAIRHGIRQYPAFLVEGKVKLVGLDPGPIECAIEMALPGQFLHEAE